MFIELGAEGGNISAATLGDMPTALFVLLEQLPWTTMVSMIAILLIVTFFVTSSDSGSLVIDSITSGGNKNAAVWQRVFWAVSQGIVASVLLVGGGLAALQAATLSSALPVALIMVLMCYGLIKKLKTEGR